LFGGAGGPAASQQRAHTGHQPRDRERFGDIVIRAGGDPTQPLGFFAARRNHDERQRSRRFPRAQPGANFQAADARRHPIEKQEIGRPLDELRPDVLAAPDALGAITFGLEVVSQQEGEIEVVFDHEDAWDGAVDQDW